MFNEIIDVNTNKRGLLQIFEELQLNNCKVQIVKISLLPAAVSFSQLNKNFTEFNQHSSHVTTLYAELSKANENLRKQNKLFPYFQEV